MASISDSMGTVTSWIGDLVRLLIGVGVLLIVAGIVFPGALGGADVFGNVMGFVGRFNSVEGLITLMLLLSFARR